MQQFIELREGKEEQIRKENTNFNLKGWKMGIKLEKIVTVTKLKID